MSPFPLPNPVLNEKATTAAVLVVALLFAALAIVDLVRVMDEEANTVPLWNKWRDRIVQAVPLTAIKILLVSWQIITQVEKRLYSC